MSHGKSAGTSSSVPQDGATGGLPFQDSSAGGQMPSATNNPTPPPGSTNLNTSPYARALSGQPPGMRPFGIGGLQTPSPIAPPGQVSHSAGQVQNGQGGAISSPLTIGPPPNMPGPDYNPPGPSPVMPTQQLPGLPVPTQNPNSGAVPVGNTPVAPTIDAMYKQTSNIDPATGLPVEWAQDMMGQPVVP